VPSREPGESSRNLAQLVQAVAREQFKMAALAGVGGRFEFVLQVVEKTLKAFALRVQSGLDVLVRH